MESAAKHNDEAIAACDRGLARAPGANGRAWLLQIKATVTSKGQKAEASQALEEALQAAETIPDKMARDMNVSMVSDKLRSADKEKK